MKRVSVCLLALLTVMIMCGHVPPTHYFTLEVPEREAASQPHAGTLCIYPFSASSHLSQDRLVYRTAPYEIKFDHYRRWIDTPAQMLTFKALDYFRVAGVFEQVSLHPPRGQKALILHGKVEAFEEVMRGAERVALIKIWAEIRDHGDQRLLWSGSLESERPITGSDAISIIRAMSESAGDLYDQILNVILKLAL